MRSFALGIVAVSVVVVSVSVSAGGAVTSKPLVAVQVDEFSVFPGTQGAPRGKVRFVITNIGAATHEFVVLRTAKPAGNLVLDDDAPMPGPQSIGGLVAGPPAKVPGTYFRLALDHAQHLLQLLDVPDREVRR